MHAMHIVSPVFGFCFPPLMDFIEQTVLILMKPSLPSLYVPSLWCQLRVLGTDLDSQAFQFCKSSGLERWLTTARTSNSRGFSALFSPLFRHQRTHGMQSCIYILYALPPSLLLVLSPILSPSCTFSLHSPLSVCMSKCSLRFVERWFLLCQVAVPIYLRLLILLRRFSNYAGRQLIELALAMLSLLSI